MKNNNNRNLLSRQDKIKNLTESFTYDNLNRLTGSQVAGQDAINLLYEDNGNIISKSDVGEDDYIYNYGENGAGLHAVTSIYHDSGLFLQQDITYTSFNKISTIIQDENEMQFTYGTDNLRRKTQLYNSGNLIKTKYYVGNYEKEITGSNTRELHYIYGGDGLAAVYIKQGTTTNMYYVSKNYLGSPIMLTKEDGTIAEQYNFDACGNRRNPTNWSYTDVPTTYLLDRGFTFHEHMDEFGLINMNGRLYDPEIGRMLSPDNNVQMPDFTQNFNRYSYALNNPLKFTDPSGEFIWFVPIVVGAVIGAELGGAAASGWNEWNPIKWNSNEWKGAAIGAIIGAGAGAGFSAAFAPGALEGSSFAATGMTTAAGESTLGWSIASNSFLMGNLNMGSAALVGGNMNEIFHAGISGLISGAAMGGLIKWEPGNIGGYLVKRNIANNLDALSGYDDFKLSAGLISYNINQGNISTVFDKNMSPFERLGMVYETAGMINYIPDKSYFSAPTIRNKMCNGYRIGYDLGGKTHFYNNTSLKRAAGYVYNALDGLYNENLIINKYATNKANQLTVNKGLEAVWNYFKQHNNRFPY